MTDYVDSMDIEGVYYEIHDTNGRVDTSKKVNRDNSTPETFTIGEDTGEMFWKDGTVQKELVSLDGTQTITNKTIDADNNTISNLEVDNLKVQATTEADKTFIVQSDGTWQLGKIQQYKRVSTFIGETGNVETLYYLDTNYDGLHAIGLYIYDSTISQFVPCSISGNVLFDNVTIGVNGSNALYVKDDGLTVPKFNTNSVSTSIDTPGVDTKVTTEKAVRDLVDTFAKSMTNTISDFKITSKLYDNLGNVLSTNDTQIGYTTIVSSTPDNSHLTTERAVSNFAKQSGKSIELTMSTSDYKLTATLKDWNNNVLSTQIVDLPLEEMIVNVSYDNVREAFIFTLKNGTELVVPATGILRGVVTETATQTLTNKTLNAPDNVITNLDETNLKNKTASDKGKSFIVQSDGSWQLGNIQQYLRVSTFIGVAGNPSVLYYLDTAFPGYEVGMYIYDTTTSNFILTSLSGNIQVDNLTIDKTADGKIEIKNYGITLDKINSDAIAVSVRETGATNFKLPTELASRNAINLMAKSQTMSYNATTSKLSTTLKDGNGTTLSTNEVTLPLGEGLVNATYDNTNEKFVFTAKDSTTKEILASNITKGVVTQTATQTLTNKTIDVDGNTLSNVELDNFKARAAGDVNKVVQIKSDGTYDVGKIGLDNLADRDIGDSGKVLQVKSDGKQEYKKITTANFENYASTDVGKVFHVKNDGTVVLEQIELDSLKPQPTGTEGQVLQVKNDGNYEYNWIDAINFKMQDLSNVGKVFGVQTDGKVGLISGTPDVDNVTIEVNTSNQLQLKDGGITVPKFNASAVSTSIPTTGSVDTKLTTEKAVADSIENKPTMFYGTTEPASAVAGDYWSNGEGYNEDIYGSDITVSLTDTDKIDVALGKKEKLDNKVTTIASTSTDTEYPSAKAVYDYINGLGLGQSIFNLCHPIGEIYVQYGGKSDPNTLYNSATITCTWTDVTSTYEARYFKADSTTAVGTEQNEQLPNISGIIRFGGVDNYKWQEGCFTYGYEQADWGNVQGGSVQRFLETITFNARGSSTVYTNGGAVRPKTSTIRIWERTA